MSNCRHNPGPTPEMAHGEGHRRGSFFPLGFDAPVDMVDAALLLLLTD